MLKNLRRKFVIIIMALVGTVLVSVLGSYYVSTWAEQRDLTLESLQRKVDETQEAYALWGTVYDVMGMHRGPKGGNYPLTVHVFETDSDGNMHSGYDIPRTMDASTLVWVVKSALKSDADVGWDSSVHVAWQRAQLDDDTWCVVVTETAFADILLENILVRDIVITVLAMAALLVISIGLSTWVLKPVQTAWDQQRQFIADASHELKTPLAVIIANTEILRNDASIGPESRRWVDSTADEASHMKNLVEELLELARTDESSSGAQGVMQRVPVDFSAMVENAALEFDAIAFERGTMIEEHIEDGIGVTGDPEWLARLCKILIDNACKYSSVGAPVVVSLGREAHKCVFSVNNHGNTIDQQDLPHVFDRFYRTDKARSRDSNAGGFGLGLAIAKGIATSHGGTIDATSDEQRGTTFSVTLPLAG